MVISWWVFFVVFVGELFLLFWLSHLLTSYFARAFYRLTRSRSFTVSFLALLYLPGTIIHELAHMLVAALMFVPVGEIEIFPVMEGDNIRLGSAEIGQTDMLRRLIIGMAPILVGLGIILLILIWGQDSLSGKLPLWQVLLTFYTVFEISNTMFSSKKDLEGALAFLGAFLSVAILSLAGLYLTKNLSWLESLRFLNFSGLTSFLITVDKLLLVPIGLNLSLLVFSKVLKR
ncbi:MAG: hypothetical protein Q7S44_01425 [bacterium]|nr:hypothetical protein [bacterium]